MSNSLVEITSSIIDLGDKRKAVLLFAASWHEGCPPLEAVLSALTGTAPDVFFGKIDAEQVSDLADKYEVTMVPTIVLMNGEKVSERMEGGFDPSQVTIAVQRLLSAPEASDVVAAATQVTTGSVDPEKELDSRLNALVKTDSVMLFMKGVPSAPRCGFSRQVVELLHENQIPFGSFDILTDDTVRQGLKKFSNWPTYPQIYVNGDLIGGLDILKEMAEDGPLREQMGVVLPPTTISPLQDRLDNLVKRSDVMVRCRGFLETNTFAMTKLRCWHQSEELSNGDAHLFHDTLFEPMHIVSFDQKISSNSIFVSHDRFFLTLAGFHEGLAVSAAMWLLSANH